MTENNNQIIQEDEIDLRELFITIWNKKIFIIAFTSIVTILSIIYAYSKTPLFEVKTVIEVGSLSNSNSNSNQIENPKNLIKKLKIENIDNADKNKTTSITSVSLVKSTSNLIEIVAQSVSNKEAISLSLITN